MIPAARPAVRTGERENVAIAIERAAYACLCLFAFSMPWSETGFATSGVDFSHWFALAALALVIFRKGFPSPARGVADLHYWMLAFAGWSIASLFWTVDRDSTVARTGTYLQLLLFTWVVWTLCTTESRIAAVLRSYVLGTSVLAVGIIENVLAGRTMDQIKGLAGTGSDRYTVSGVNPNDLGLMLALSIPMALYLLARRSGRQWTTVLLWAQLLLAGTGILLSGSRGAALAASGGLFMLPMVLGRLSRLQKALMAVVVAGTVVGAMSLVPPETWGRFMDLGKDLTEGTMTHRTQIWAASTVLFREHPLAGVGSGAHPVAVTSLIGRPLVAHNTFMSALAELGVVGELLLLGMLTTAFHCAWKMPRLQRSFWVLVLAVWGIGACSGTLEYRKMTWLLLSLLVAHAYVRRRIPGGIRRHGARSVCLVSAVF